MNQEEIKKSAVALGGMRANHKYIRRTGAPGNYKYWYHDPVSGKIYSSDDKPQDYQ